MRIRIIAPLKNVVVSEPIDNVPYSNFQIVPPSYGVFGKNFDHPRFRNYFGQLTVDKIINSTCFFYDGTFKNISTQVPSQNPIQTLERVNILIHYYFNVLWLVKDHSVSFHDCIIVVGELKDSMMYTNPRFSLFSNYEGKYSEITLTKEDIEVNNKYFAQLSADDILKKESVPSHRPEIQDPDLKKGFTLSSEMNFAPYDYERIQRALLMLQMARKSSFLPIKISQFVVLLESLTSTDENTEVTHQVSERVANLIGQSKAEKFAIYKDVKEAYSIRSKFFHGQKLKHKIGKKSMPISVEHFVNVSQSIDSIARKTLKIAIEKFSLFNGPDEELRKHFISELFSDNNTTEEQA